MPGCNFGYKGGEEKTRRQCWTVKIQKKYEKRQDISRIDENIEHMWIECQGENNNKNYLVVVFYQPRPENKEKLNEFNS